MIVTAARIRGTRPRFFFRRSPQTTVSPARLYSSPGRAPAGSLFREYRRRLEFAQPFKRLDFDQPYGKPGTRIVRLGLVREASIWYHSVILTFYREQT